MKKLTPRKYRIIVIYSKMTLLAILKVAERHKDECSDFQYLDTKLLNLPKYLYLQKLLKVTSSNEPIKIDYRSSLCLRAKTMEGCPSGNPTTRKSTKF